MRRPAEKQAKPSPVGILERIAARCPTTSERPSSPAPEDRLEVAVISMGPVHRFVLQRVRASATASWPTPSSVARRSLGVRGQRSRRDARCRRRARRLLRSPSPRGRPRHRAGSELALAQDTARLWLNSRAIPAISPGRAFGLQLLALGARPRKRSRRRPGVLVSRPSWPRARRPRSPRREVAHLRIRQMSTPNTRPRSGGRGRQPWKPPRRESSAPRPAWPGHPDRQPAVTGVDSPSVPRAEMAAASSPGEPRATSSRSPPDGHRAARTPTADTDLAGRARCPSTRGQAPPQQSASSVRR
jgi:hypothetical protein